MASATLECLDQRHAVGCVGGVLHLFNLFVESTDRFVLCHSQLSCVSIFASHADAHLDFSARVPYISGHGQQAYFHPWARLSARSVVLFSDRFHAEIAACLSCFAAFELYYPAGDEITFTAGLFSGARGDGTTLARGMDFSVHLFAACVLSRLTISIRHFLTPLALIILLLAPLPRMLEALRNSGWRAARPSAWLMTGLAAVLIVLAIRIYPHYMPFLNSLSMGRPNYELVNDSNLDWDHALPEVADWAQSRGLHQVPLDAYGFFDPTVYMKQAELWNCQNPSANDGGQLAVVSAGYILDGHNCRWLLQYPHEPLAGGSMYAFQLPAVIPVAGSPGGPPNQADWRNIGGMPGEVDASTLFHSLVSTRNSSNLPGIDFSNTFKKSSKREKRNG